MAVTKAHKWVVCLAAPSAALKAASWVDVTALLKAVQWVV